MRRRILCISAVLAGICFLAAFFSAIMKEINSHRSVTAFSAVASENCEITLPCMISGTTLLARNIVRYEGPFLEDGSSIEATDVTALVLQNVGKYGIESAQVTLRQGETDLVFLLTDLPPGESLLVLEANRRKYLQKDFASCSGWQLNADRSWVSMEDVCITEIGMSEIKVTNCSDYVISDIQIYYKNYIADADMLIGGITNRVWLGTLLPGDSVTVCPPRYASNYSRVVCIKAN